MIVDSRVVLAGFLPDEAQAQAQAVIRDHVIGRRQLAAPSRGRISAEQAQETLATFEWLAIELQAVTWQSSLSFAQRFDRSAHDAAYLALADAAGQPLLTGDMREVVRISP